MDGALRLGFGGPLTGVHWTGDFPREDYELEVEAARLAGTDFFAGITFPVGEEHLTLILGGWGGALVGLSCIDGQDAAGNETRRTIPFERGKPVTARIRVNAARVEVVLDGSTLYSIERAGRVFSLRAEVLPSRPLGIATYATRSEISVVRWRPCAERGP